MAGGRRKGGICRAVRQNVPEGVPPSGTFSFYRMGRRRAHGAGVFPAFFSRRGGPAAPVFSDLEYTMELLKFCLRGKIPVFPVFFLSAPGRGIGRSSVTMPGTPAMMTGAILPDTMDRHLPGTRKMPPITPGIIAASERFSGTNPPGRFQREDPPHTGLPAGLLPPAACTVPPTVAPVLEFCSGNVKKRALQPAHGAFFAFCRSPAGAPGLVSARCGGRFRTGRGAGSSPPALS